MISKLLLDSINRNLKLHFGFDPSTNKANFRLIWCPDEMEDRQGSFAKFDNSGNFIGLDTGVQRVKKYIILGDVYAIEKLVPNVMSDEIKTDDRLIYEAFFNFASKSGDIINPNWEAVKYIVLLATQGEKHTAEYYMAQHDNAFQAEVDKFRDLLET